MAEPNRLAAALSYEQDRPAFGNPSILEQGRKMRERKQAEQVDRSAQNVKSDLLARALMYRYNPETLTGLTDTPGPQTLDEAAGLDPRVDRSTFLPYSQKEGLHVPAVAADLMKLATASNPQYSNLMQPEEAMPLATNMMGGGLAATRPAFSLGMGAREHPVINFNAQATKLAEYSPRTIKNVLGISPTVRNVNQLTSPGIYKPYADLARESEAMVASENPMMKQLWNVDRGDLANIANREGTIADPIRELIPSASVKQTGSEAVRNIITPRNTERLIETLKAAETQAPNLYRGMKGWYVLDPMWQRLKELVGPEEATLRFDRLNKFGGIESPNMKVVDETRRAAAANFMNESGKFEDWAKYGGLPYEYRVAKGLVPELGDLPGRVGHVRASNSQRKVIQTGEHGMDSPKAPLYISASGTPETGFQTNVPVGDAHFSRGIGLADVRTNKGFDASVTTPELQHLTPWWRDISNEVGLQAVPGQAVGWGMFAPQTGVETKIGAPKLELITDLIQRYAAKTGQKPETVRDKYLLGQSHLGANMSPAGAGLAVANDTGQE
jgi:hypothetical protein